MKTDETQGAYKTARKYHDALDDLLDRPISYNPAFKKITGRTSAAVWLSQQWYWAKRTKDPNGWVYKSAKECTEETGLTDNEQHTARMICKKLGVIEEKLKGVPATMHYRIVKEKIYELLGVQFPTEQETEIPIERETEFPAESETSLDDGSEFPEKQESDGVGNFNTTTTPTIIPGITNTGAEAPPTPPASFGVEWQIGAGSKNIVIPENDTTHDKASSWAALIAMNNADLEPLALEFMVSANKLPGSDNIKYWRKTLMRFRNCSSRPATADDVRRAVLKHIAARLPIKSPGSIEWALIEIIDPTPEAQEKAEPEQFDSIRRWVAKKKQEQTHG